MSTWSVLCFFILDLCFQSLIKPTFLLVNQRRNLVVALYLECLLMDVNSVWNMFSYKGAVNVYSIDLPEDQGCYWMSQNPLVSKISPTKQHITNADPMEKTFPTRSCAFNKPLDKTHGCLKTQFSIVQQHDHDLKKTGR